MPVMGWFDEEYEADNDCYGIGEEKRMEEKKWWHTPGAWGSRGGHDTCEVRLPAPGLGAWVRYSTGVQQWMTAETLDGMTQIPSPPPENLAEIRQLRERLNAALATNDFLRRDRDDAERSARNAVRAERERIRSAAREAEDAADFVREIIEGD